MKNSYTRSLSLLALMALPLAAADVPVVRGHVRSPEPISFSGLLAGMEDILSHTQIHRVDLTFDGSFEFRGVPTGDYILYVTDLHGHSMAQEFVNIHEHMDELAITIPGSGRGNSLPGKVSLAQLMHPPAKKAVQAFQTAQRLSESGRYDEALSALEKAVRISPDFGEAHTNLAVQHIRLQQFEEAAAESRRAMQIAGPDPINLCNLAFAQFQISQFADAEASVRAALRLNSGYLQAHLILGTLLARDAATKAEAIVHLQRAVAQFPSAQKTLDSLHGVR